MTARSLIVLACLWIAGVSYVAGINWPVFPLDLPAADPEVRAVYDRAIWAHVVQYSLIADSRRCPLRRLSSRIKAQEECSLRIARALLTRSRTWSRLPLGATSVSQTINPTASNSGETKCRKYLV